MPPPVVIEQESPGSESQIQLQPSEMPGGARTGAAYGPAAPIAVAPLGSTGYSVDMRYPRVRGQRPRGIPPSPRVTTGPKLVPPSAPTDDESPVTLPPLQTKSEPSKPDTNGKPATPKSDAPRYTMTTEPGVATGAPVTTLDAIRALKDEGFNTVINLLPEDQADAAEPTEVTRAGMAYVSLPITPKTLSRETLDKFNRVIAESKRPIYVHDSDGRLTGAMWYLNRLLVAKLPEDAARRQAIKAGLKEPDSDDLTTELWLAINRILSEP
jgi:protein tyrosine phosphatase (PTP) superfamily phosphohydrolase (DUF442 family)